MQDAFFAEAFTGGIACTQLKQEQNKHQQQIVKTRLLCHPLKVVKILKISKVKNIFLNAFVDVHRTYLVLASSCVKLFPSDKSETGKLVRSGMNYLEIRASFILTLFRAVSVL